jgi:hypothetical protein
MIGQRIAASCGSVIAFVPPSTAGRPAALVIVAMIVISGRSLAAQRHIPRDAGHDTASGATLSHGDRAPRRGRIRTAVGTRGAAGTDAGCSLDGAIFVASYQVPAGESPMRGNTGGRGRLHARRRGRCRANRSSPKGQDMSQTAPPSAGGMMEPHRGTMILVFGILSLLICFLFGIAAWVMGNRDLEKMAAGQMDATGEGLTKAGKICGMISVILTLLGVIFAVVMIVLAGGLAALSASGGSP